MNRFSILLAALIFLTALIAAPGHADLTLEAEANPDPVEAGQVIDVQITVSATAVANNVTLNLTWPAELDGTPFTTGGGGCMGNCTEGETLEWVLGTLGPGSSITVGFSESVLPLTPDGMFSLEFELLEGATNRGDLSIPVEIKTDSPLELFIDPLPDPVAPSGTLVYEVVYGNAGPIQALNAQLSFPVPSGTQFVAATGGGQFASDTVTWDLGSMAANDGNEERVTVQVDAVSEGTLLFVDAAMLSGDVNLIPHESRATAVSRVATEALELAMEVSPDPVDIGQSVDTQITVSNPNGALTQQLKLRVLWPEELDGTPFIAGGGGCVGSCTAGEYVNFDLGVLGPNQSQIVSLNEVTELGLVNGNLIPLEIELLENDLPARTVSRTIRVQTASPLEIFIDPLLDPVIIADPLVYEITYANTASSPANNAALSFTIPPGATFTSATGGGTLQGGTVTWNLGTLSPNRGNSVRVSTVVDPLADGTLFPVCMASVSAEVNFQPHTSRAMAVSRIDTETLRVAFEVNPDPVQPNEVIDAQVTISNPAGPLTGALSVRVLWPEELDGSPFRTPGGACTGSCNAGEYLQWALIDPLGVGASTSIGFTENTKLSLVAGTLVPLEVEVLEVGSPARTVSRTVRSQADSPLELFVDPSADPVPPSTTIDYRIIFGNNSASPAEDATLSLPLPDGTQFLAATGGGVLQAGMTVHWDLGTVPANGGGLLLATVNVAPLAVGTLLVVDQATFSGEVNFVQQESRTSTVSRVGNEPLELSSVITPNPVLANDPLDAQITVRNPTGSISGDLTLQVIWPEELLGSPAVTDGGSCAGACNPGEYLVWDLGMLGAGGEVTVSFVENTVAGLSDGDLIPIEIELLEDGQIVRTLSEIVAVQPFVDTDNDGEPDIYDDDDDDDGMPDWWENLHGLDPTNDDADEDPDLDGLTNLEEFIGGTDPNDFNPIFFDAFESGDTTAWSATVPQP